jgi:hypothetical protein
MTALAGLEIREYGRRNQSRWLRGTLYPLKLALTSLTSGSRSVAIVRSQTQATEFSFSDSVGPLKPPGIGFHFSDSQGYGVGVSTLLRFPYRTGNLLSLRMNAKFSRSPQWICWCVRCSQGSWSAPWERGTWPAVRTTKHCPVLLYTSPSTQCAADGVNTLIYWPGPDLLLAVVAPARNILHSHGYTTLWFRCISGCLRLVFIYGPSSCMKTVEVLNYLWGVQCTYY